MGHSFVLWPVGVSYRVLMPVIYGDVKFYDSSSTSTRIPEAASTSDSAAESPAQDVPGSSGKPAGSASLAHPHYAVYNSKGDRVPVSAIVDSMRDVQVVMLGEYHDDPVAHHLELLLLKQALRRYRPVRPGEAGERTEERRMSVSLEMLETDVQEVVDAYLAGYITETDLIKDARLWPNYEHDYRPLVELARLEGLPVVCANAPRRYVSLCRRRGRAALDQLPEVAKQWLAPLPFAPPSAAYIHKTDQLFRQEPSAQQVSWDPPDDRAVPASNSSREEAVDSNFLDAQSLWDATMAHSIAKRLSIDAMAPGQPALPSLVLHVCGKFHSEGWMGIPEHLRWYHTSVRMLIVTFLPTAGPVALTAQEFKAAHLSQYGHYVVMTDANQPRSFEAEHPV
ncbi:hypothetical protein WJX72_000076 [[Myrmecia] bisecta]|uniref:Haem-binding uptake Tiki superfamily ChaN domain-containing protein n=1 Tax=[Myrmecia] bisecta TaxID=41462 RepID=A0AAW1PPI9_9CHLO